jgi:hypothetical protein
MEALPAPPSAMRTVHESPKGTASDAATPAASSRFDAQKIKEMLGARE